MQIETQIKLTSDRKNVTADYTVPNHIDYGSDFWYAQSYMLNYRQQYPNLYVTIDLTFDIRSAFYQTSLKTFQTIIRSKLILIRPSCATRNEFQFVISTSPKNYTY